MDPRIAHVQAVLASLKKYDRELQKSLSHNRERRLIDTELNILRIVEKFTIMTSPQIFVQ